MTSQTKYAVVAIAWIAGCVSVRAAEQPNVPDLLKAIPVHDGVLEVDAGESWSARVAVPEMAPDEAPVLSLCAYARAGDGGCNWVMQVLVNDAALTESFMRRRLLNKLPWFDPPGTKYHFSWYDPQRNVWMTIFSNSGESNWGGTGRDLEYVFDLTGLVEPGKSAKITFTHAMPSLSAAINKDRAPLVLRDVEVGVLKQEDVARLRRHVGAADDLKQAPVVAELPEGAEPGERPYELAWSGRSESPPAQVAWDDLAGWTCRVSGDMEVKVEASVEKRLWRKQLAKLTVAGGTKPTTVLLRPASPILIRTAFDAADMWLFADFERRKDRHPQVSAHLTDAAGREVSINLGRVSNSYWVLLHGVLAPLARAHMRLPAKFNGLSIAFYPVKGKRRFYLESLAFHERNRKPFVKDTRPQEPSFPIGAAGMLPTAPTGCRISAAESGAGAVFTCESSAGVLRFHVDPRRGVFDGVTAQWNAGPRFKPMAGGKVRLDLPADALSKPKVLIRSKLNAGRLVARWRRGMEWQATYELRGRTLVVDVECKGGGAAGLNFGVVSGLPGARRVDVPYMKHGLGLGCGVVCGRGLFVSVLADWYHSDCSRVDGMVGKATDGAGIRLLVGTDYRPLTNGKRNDLRDRVLVTVSPEFADVLPSIPHPRSPHMERLSKYMFCMVSYMRPRMLRTMKRYGIDHVIACDFARFYVQDFAAGFAGRWRPHPSLTLKQIQDYRRGIKDLGYLFGAYSDFRDWFPLNEFFDTNCVSLNSAGDLVDGWYGNFRTKPNYMPVLARLVGKKVHELYPADSVYMDTHTCVGLNAVDFEAGVPHAGIAREQVYYNGECILEAGKWYGTTMSEGRDRRLYAGIVDMDYASLFMDKPGDEIVPLVDFDLLKIHPLNLGTMMGYGPSIFFKLDREKLGRLYRDTGAGLAPVEFYKYVSASLAYGHMLMTGYSYLPKLSRMIHLYALMQGIQTRYLTQTAAAIHYHNGREFVSTSQALLEDTQRLGRLRVRYSNGLLMHVNYNAGQSWTVDGYELPPYGWLIEKPGEVLAFSAAVNGHRVDYVRCPEYIYLNSNGRRTRVEALDVDGAVWLKRRGRAWRVIPCGDLGPWEIFPPEGLPKFQQDMRLKRVPPNRGCRVLAIDTAMLMGADPLNVDVQALDESGRTVEAAVVRTDDLTIAPSVKAVDYVMRRGDR
ncbi:MAG: hypothetical protein GXP31_17620 [Kiritimatiellaeota bacterium]|nr:hypothetical protein [Kiritimatiellota bacterium]